ncbi:hypothetical protein BLL37_08985 [Pseudomonas azotoformans]|uniref:Uncharacterized protein n=1 Tax=Pseudomonas azotoformans TaxID=47878 RepID=A0A1V2JQA0_PSEAZ|nr:hypothetical protein BFL39_18320 [Pseudomonas azotoformans]ONH46986.1 hypothetical protein BLL37_08985 [Pseudomonas azotoformans]
MYRWFIRRIDAGKLGDLFLPGLFIEPFWIACLAHIKRGIDKDFHIITVANQRSHQGAIMSKRRNKRGQYNQARVSKQLADFTHPSNIFTSPLVGEIQVKS